MRTKKNIKQFLLNSIDRESFICFLNDHTIIETQKHFNISYNQLHYLMDNYDIKRDASISNKFRFKGEKDRFQILLKEFPKEKMLKDYIEGGYKKSYLISLYKIKENQLYKIFNHYNLETYKPKKESIIRDENNRYLHDKTIKDINRINKEEFQQYWNSHNKEEIASYFNIPLATVDVYINYNKLTKSPSAIIKTRENTMRSRYGTPYALQEKNYKDKRKKSLYNRYGDENFNNIEKIKATNLKKYGTTTVSQLEYYKKKIKNTNLRKYGVEALGQKFQEDYSLEYKKLYHNKEESIKFLKQHSLTARQLCSLFNCSLSSIYFWTEKYNLSSYIKNEKSHYEKEIADYLYSLGIKNIIHNDRKDLGNKQEIDIYCPDLRLGIEFNGTYWHSDIFLPKDYHFLKSKLAASKGIRLIHIYEYEWEDEKQQSKLKSMLRIATGNIKEKIFARKCEIKEISNKEASILNNEVHLQGHRNAKITCGLFYKNKLVQLMSFSHHPKYGWEIIRGCPGSNNIVIGGVSKLFKYFIKKYNPSSIFSYCDFNKFAGTSYEELGMSFIGYTGPDKKIIIKGQILNRNPSKYKEYKDKVDACIWGAGSKKYLWTKETIKD